MPLPTRPATTPLTPPPLPPAPPSARPPATCAHQSHPPPPPCRYYARGLFTNPIICNWDGLRGPGWGALQQVKGFIWGVTSLFCGSLDWPLRWMSGGVLANKVKVVRSSTQSYDPALASELWEASAEVAGLPKEAQA